MTSENYTTVYVDAENQAKVQLLKESRQFSRVINQLLAGWNPDDISETVDYIIVMMNMKDNVESRLKRLEKIGVGRETIREVIRDFINDVSKLDLKKPAEQKMRADLLKIAETWHEIGSLDVEKMLAGLRMYYNTRALEMILQDWHQLRIAEEMRRGEGEFGTKETAEQGYKPKESVERTVADTASETLDKIDSGEITAREVSFFADRFGRIDEQRAQTHAEAEQTNQKEIDEDTIENFKLMPEERAEVAQSRLNPVIERGLTPIPVWMIKHWKLKKPKDKSLIVSEEMPEILEEE